MTAAIECVGLSKVYGGRVVALSDVSLNIASGASFALLGENGAGKSTFVRLLMGFLHPSAGYLRVLDETHVERAHDRIGYVHERPLFEPRFTGRECLTYAANLFWGSVGLLANCIVLAALTITLSPPIATRYARMVFLFWLALTLYSFTQGNVVSWLAVPLVPLSAAYTLAAAGFSFQAFVALTGAAIYLVCLTVLAQWWMARRDLSLH